MTSPQPTGALVIRTGGSGPIYAAKWRREGKQILRNVGPAWLDEDGLGGWHPRKGRPPTGYFNEKQAVAHMAAMVAEHDAREAEIARGDREREERGVTFREVARAWQDHRERVKRDKPSTQRDRRSMLAEPGAPHSRGTGVCKGRIMAAFGDLPAAGITPRHVSAFLNRLDDELTTAGHMGVQRNVNKHRSVLSAIFNYAMRSDTFELETNPVRTTDKRREPTVEALDYYTVEQVEALARAVADGAHRTGTSRAIVRRLGESDEHLNRRRAAWSEERVARQAEDAQDAEVVRVAAYTGLRRGELIALRWRDVSFANRKLALRRAISARQEQTPKSGKGREVPLTDQAMMALDRLSRRGDFTAPGEFVFANRLGQRLDADALSDRITSAMVPAGLPRLRFHDLRHTYGSLLAAGGIDLASIKAAMGHAKISTTERYLHARPASELADRFTAAIGGPSTHERDGSRAPSAA